MTVSKEKFSGEAKVDHYKTSSKFTGKSTICNPLQKSSVLSESRTSLEENSPCVEFYSILLAREIHRL